MKKSIPFRNFKGTLIVRNYSGRVGRPKGAIGPYNLSAKGLKKKQEVMRKLLARLRAEGRTGWPKGVKQTIEHRVKNSCGVLTAIAEGRFDPVANVMKYVNSKDYEPKSCRGTHGLYRSKKNNRSFRYDSSWELIRMKFLEHSKDVKSYKKCPIRLVYKINGKEHYFFPDLLIKYHDGTKVLEEIKPRPLIKLPINKAKFKVARIYCKSANLVFRVISCKEDLKRKAVR